jgi:DNA-binding transcriptional MerR regulator
MKRPKNLFGDTRTETAEHYERLLYVHKLKLEGYKFNEIKKIVEKERSDFKEDTVKNLFNRLKELENLTVPIKTK